MSNRLIGAAQFSVGRLWFLSGDVSLWSCVLVWCCVNLSCCFGMWLSVSLITLCFAARFVRRNCVRIVSLFDHLRVVAVGGLHGSVVALLMGMLASVLRRLSSFVSLVLMKL